MDATEIMRQLQEPFPAEDIEWRVGSTTKDKAKGMALAYVTNRAIQNRLDEIFGPFGWRNEFKQWKEKSQLCGISIKWEGEWITKWDGADDSNMEAVKGGLSDSMKRAAYQWGIGRYLYKLPSVWVEIEPFGNSYKIKTKPKLPAWALPKGNVAGDKQEKQAQDAMTPKEWARFWAKMGELGLDEETVHKEAGEQSIKHYTKTRVAKLYSDITTKYKEEKQSA